ncbi:MAG: hypothetical protein H6Q89_341, partial [Myxococcaceae bacterium]|nr:hypothetical protein [Myxococcaceae bacterium]
MLRLCTLPLLALTACNFVQPEIRIGAAQGIPSISGTAEVELVAFVCGNVIPAGAYSVTTQVVSGGCELSFDKDIEIVSAADYQRLPELGSATTLLQRIEVKITKLGFIDADTNVALDPQTRINSASF